MTGSDTISPTRPIQTRDVCDASGERCPKLARLPIHLSKHRPSVVIASDLPRDIVALAAFAPWQGPALSA